MPISFLFRRKVCIFATECRYLHINNKIGTPKERILYVGGLIAASSVTSCKQGKIITFSQRETFERDGIRIEVMPIWEME